MKSDVWALHNHIVNTAAQGRNSHYGIAGCFAKYMNLKLSRLDYDTCYTFLTNRNDVIAYTS